MTFIVGQPVPIRYYHGVSGATILARVIDQADGVFGAELTLTENAALLAAGYDGFYESTFTPNAVGHWKVALKVGGVRYGNIYYYVGGGLSAQEKTDVEAEATDAIEADDLDHLLVVAHPTGDPVADTILDLIMNKDGGQTFARATDSLEALQELCTTLATAAALAIVDGFHDVPGADAITNAQMRDVIGNKADTLAAAINATNSLMRYMKGALGAGWTNESLISIYNEIIALMWSAGPGVPTADSMLDYIMNIDPGQTFDRTTDSLEALGSGHITLEARKSTEISFTENREVGDGVGEIQIWEQQVNTYIRDIFLYCNLDTLETAGEGGIVTIRAYHRVDGAAYSDQPEIEINYTVGVSNEYPNLSLFGVSEWVQITMQCSVAVTAQRACPFRGSYRRTS